MLKAQDVAAKLTDFPKQIENLRKHMLSIQRHIITGTQDQKLKACFKHFLLCEYMTKQMISIEESKDD